MKMSPLSVSQHSQATQHSLCKPLISNTLDLGTALAVFEMTQPTRPSTVACAGS